MPDPEVLKAVWSQTTGKEDAPTINSLKGIADDLTTVPFSLHEVKSEDGGTPPPATSGPLRMSASDVTKAFQMVPSASSNTMSPSSSRSTLFTSAVTSPANVPKSLKPVSSGPGQPPMNGIARPHYMGYPPHMSSHTPSPPMMYPHMGSGALQGQPMWMPMAPQQGAMMRGQQSSPYSPSMMPYHPQGMNGMYPQVAANHTGPSPPGAYPGASHMMVSPVMTHAAPVPPHMMYGASPVMLPVPAPGMAPPASSYPGPIGMGRGAPPIRGAMDNRSPQAARSTQPPPPARFPPVHNPSYSHIPTQPFVRPSW